MDYQLTKYRWSMYQNKSHSLPRPIPDQSGILSGENPIGHLRILTDNFVDL